MRLFRQETRGDWKKVFARITTELQSLMKASVTAVRPSGQDDSPSTHPFDAASVAKDAIVLHQAGKLDEAERLYREILAADPGNFDAMHCVAVIALQRGNYAEAVRQLDAALQVNPSSAEAFNNRALR